MAKRYCISSSLTPSSSSTDAAEESTPSPAPPTTEADEIAPRDYDLPVCSQMAIPDDYECDDIKDDKIEGGGRVDHLPAPRRRAQTDFLDPSVAR